jgi:glyceraldehyde-3-phosphate dehydrogenase/erythrose-4-phosphate dehydrogenase
VSHKYWIRHGDCGNLSKGKLNGLAVRVPLTNASLTDCVFEVNRPVTVEEVNLALQKASENGPLQGILGYETNALVSTDYTNDVRSSIIDALSTQVIDGTMIKIYAWVRKNVLVCIIHACDSHSHIVLLTLV